MNYICEPESIYYALILLSLICCIPSATIIHHFSRECEKGMINTGKQQLQESIKMCKKHKKIPKKKVINFQLMPIHNIHFKSYINSCVQFTFFPTEM